MRNGWKGIHIEAAGRCWVGTVGIDKGEEATVAAGRMDGVHPEVSGFGVMARGMRKVVDHMRGGVVAGDIGGGRLVSVFL